jgi:hypothetical protein
LLPFAQMAAMSLGTLTAAKILLRTQPLVTGDDFNREAWAVLEARADELAAICYAAVTDREKVPVPPTASERPSLRLVRPARGVKWCPTPVDMHGPSPFPEDMSRARLREVADVEDNRAPGAHQKGAPHARHARSAIIGATHAA